MLTIIAATVLTAPQTFKVMSYNIWVGGTRHQPLSQTVKAIQTSKADIVGIQEPGPNLAAIAKALGWNHSAESSVITRFSIEKSWDVPNVSWGAAIVKLPDGRKVYVYNCHLNAYPYGPYEIRDKKANTVAEAIAVERNAGRLPQVQKFLAHIQSNVPAGASVVFTGDFNAPSHLDWVEATKNRTFNLVVPWPVSSEVHREGFQDSYRTIHKNPVTKPGYTWSPGYPVPNIDADDVMDRIDFVYFRGPGLRPTDSQIVAEPGPLTDIPVDPWPSDHRAVLTTFRLN